MSDDAPLRPGDADATPLRDAHRRALLKAGGLLLGASLLPAGLAACVERGARDDQPSAAATAAGPGATATRKATPADEAVLAVVAEAIFPTTPDSPGAIEAGVPPVVTRILNDCWSDEDRGLLLDGLDSFLVRCQSRHGTPFLALAPEQRLTLLAEEDAAATPHNRAHWFSPAYAVIAQAYWSSEVGATQALRWVAVPGRWIGCTTLEPGQSAWG
ncbi:MAG: gluconate 2-dehydrogenase subunit 3 family protein [Gemmatimonadaceae bacterium]|nr:gluconate 2-dehydrogenase subunit 3 family protein [Gemmatimonadaceae bacterium]